ncbi:hypothetical protein GCM10010308_75420 [Streptomyces vinaceusdrappus]|nr:hypothetical protein GCM10010301_71410 [Streptomyces plicatus]GHC45212.1 hypothetical protein GCM10010308_75420 [Streptomyces vinaceusdrappus]
MLRQALELKRRNRLIIQASPTDLASAAARMPGPCTWCAYPYRRGRSLGATACNSEGPPLADSAVTADAVRSGGTGLRHPARLGRASYSGIRGTRNVRLA